MNEMMVFYIAVTVVGLVVGSFYNVCIHRGITGESVVNPPRSKCPKCGHFLSWWENIPLVSWLILRGKCHNCKKPISARYPIVEALSGGLALALALKFGMTPAFFGYFAFSGFLIVLSFIDLETMLLPLYPMIIGAVVAFGISEPVLGISWLDSGLAAVAGAGCFWLIRFMYKRMRGVEGMGDGDVWLMLMLGPLVGLDMLPLVIIVSGLGLVLSSVVLTKGSASERMGMRIPFGPFLCMATMFAVLVGDKIMKWWLG